jgi:hypothetical protein
MPARIRTQQTSTTTRCECDPACPHVVSFLDGLLTEPWQYAPMDLRLECFEAMHVRTCERCERFSRAFTEWLEQNAREREEARISAGDQLIHDNRTLLLRLRSCADRNLKEPGKGEDAHGMEDRE